MQDTLSARPAAGAAARHEGLEQRISDAITAFCGKMLFVYVHAALFAAWIATRGFGHDAFPFNFLTMAVSLEAIFLSTFILISQNRQQALADARNEQVQDRLQQMLRDVISDEKLDLTNENMIRELLNRIDVQHVRPIAEHVNDIAAAVARIEARVGDGRSG
ncbi:MAG TPA: DUF1003 domain-containing protein [Dehalococcoidia bacterium]|nr:DUF1003 domain-containing protein [Dehalococcoidia bacterium]